MLSCIGHTIVGEIIIRIGNENYKQVLHQKKSYPLLELLKLKQIAAGGSSGLLVGSVSL
jgi:hypothetical protein